MACDGEFDVAGRMGEYLGWRAGIVYAAGRAKKRRAGERRTALDAASAIWPSNAIRAQTEVWSKSGFDCSFQFLQKIQVVTRRDRCA